MPQRSRAARRSFSDRAVDIVEGVAAMTGGDLEPVNGAGGQSSGIITQTNRDTGVAGLSGNLHKDKRHPMRFSSAATSAKVTPGLDAVPKRPSRVSPDQQGIID